MRQGTIVDATIIAAPPSTKNKSKARDPEMHQTKKGNQWHFGMKAHIGVDVASGVVHTVTGTAANEADINQTAALLHGREEAVFADAGYTGADKRPELEDCDVDWNIAIKRSIIKALPKDLRDWAEAVESALSQVRVRDVESGELLPRHGGLQRAQLIHHLGIDLQPARGIDDHGPSPRRLRLAQRVLHQLLYGRSMLRPYPGPKHRHSNLLAQLPQLLRRRRPIDVGRHERRRLLLELQPPSELGGSGGLPRSL